MNESSASTVNKDFKIIVESKTGSRQSHSIHLVAPTIQDKEAWISDISQCLDNIHMHSLLSPGLSGSSGVHHAVKDPLLFKDDVDIRFSRTLNSCKLPQVRYATPERLLQRLTDLRFLSIDFLNTFLLTYRVFTDGETVLNALKKVFYDPPTEPLCECEQTQELNYLDIPYQEDGCRTPRRTSAASSVSGYCSEGADRDRSMSGDSSQLRHRVSRRMCQHNFGTNTRGGYSDIQDTQLAYIPESTAAPVIVHDEDEKESADIQIHSSPKKKEPQDDAFLAIPKTIATSSSTDTIIENLLSTSGPSSPSNLSSVTLVGSTGSGSVDKETPTEETKHSDVFYGKAPKSPLPERKRPRQLSSQPVQIEMTTNILPPTPTGSEFDHHHAGPTPQTPIRNGAVSKAIENALASTAQTVTAIVPQSQSSASTSPSKVVSTASTTLSSAAATTAAGTGPVIITTASSQPTLAHSAISPPHLGVDRRPSVGCNIPHAALCQHRYSLQLNGDGGVKVGFIVHFLSRTLYFFGKWLWNSMFQK